jgi:hypothetical protein
MVKFSVQMDKGIGTSKDMGLETEPHLLFEDIPDLYDQEGELNEKYRYLLHLAKNQGIEGSMMARMPKYEEIDFYDRFGSKAKDTSPKKNKAPKLNLTQNRDFAGNFSEILEYRLISDSVKTTSINYSFSPKCYKYGRPM